MCSRKESMDNWLEARANCRSIKTPWMLQTYRNLVDIEGEYDLTQCFMSSPTEFQGILSPIVFHQRHWYKQKEIKGVLYYIQAKYLTPEDVKNNLKNTSSKETQKSRERHGNNNNKRSEEQGIAENDNREHNEASQRETDYEEKGSEQVF